MPCVPLKHCPHDALAKDREASASEWTARNGSLSRSGLHAQLSLASMTMFASLYSICVGYNSSISASVGFHVLLTRHTHF